MSLHPQYPTLLAFNGFEACILVNGEKTPHYGVECNEAKRRVTCWIESKAGKPFAYQYKRIKTDYDCRAKEFLDGKCVAATVIRKERGPNYFINRPSVRISATEVRNLAFGSLELTDDDAYLENSVEQQNLGEIKLVFEQIRNIRVSQRARVETLFSQPVETQKIHERSKKALSHQVRYGETVKSDVRAQEVLRSDSCGKLATFIFKYRPLAMLQANGIAPLDPIVPAPHEASPPYTPPPLPKKRKLSDVKPDIDIDDDEGQGDIEATERALLAQLEKVRQQKLTRNSNTSASKRVKQEPRAYFAPGEIIDLT
ncbi:hypothetical protein GALMADRAFT_156246 [Galerina marginata CBS 339.88]|uniref:DUF7918 domain-containing protein n=1 Tax=Galerina marginata (strain CBS 339.88) TaxID=685588 RepID=A0A067T1B2_GALM3|nr:hypothetical protein GALMADRAFT_156246 [Galerina marginata CBS 339.88]